MSSPVEQSSVEPILTVTPVEPALPSEERITSLDLIRGIAILGILPMNMAFYMIPSEGFAPSQGGIQWWGDYAVAAATIFFITGKMITQLAILFGAGLAIQSDRADAAGRPFAGYYAWRMVLLLLIGLAHALLLWFGDILLSYALIGMAALLFRRLSQNALLYWIAGFLTWYLLFATSMMLLAPLLVALFAPAAEGQGQDAAASALAYYLTAEGQRQIYQQGPWLDMVIHRALVVGSYLVMFVLAVFWQLLACFLLGIYLLRRGVFQDIEGQRGFLRRLAVFGLGVGVPLHVAAVVVYLWNPLSLLSMLLNTLGAIPQALGYLALTVLWSRSTLASGLQARLRAVGRMALTNYLMQSVICGLIFYSYGLGLFGKFGHSFGLAVVLGIWLLELAWSPVWLRHFTIGPVEWLWRSLADRRLRPFRRAAAPAAS